MKTIQKRKRFRVPALILAVTLCFSNSFALDTHAETSDKKQKSMEDDLSDLNSDKAAVSKELSDAASSLNSLVADIEDTQKELGIAQAREAGQYELMKKRIKYIYEESSGDFLTMLFEAESMADLLNRADFIATVSEYDRDMLEKLKTIHSEIETQEAKLLSQQEDLKKQQKTLSGKYSELTSLISSKSDELEKYKKELAEAEAARKAAEALAKQKEAEKKAAEEQKKKEEEAQENADSGKDNTAGKPQTGGSTSSGGSGTSTKPETPSTSSDLALFAGILECEAGSTNYDGLLAVATVIMNRVESPRYPNTLKGVIYQSGQFQPTWTGKLDKVLARGPKSLCYTVAKDALAGKRLNAVKDCYQFRASWTGREGIIIGGNVFF